jgi:hypothetical protein
LRQKQQAIRRSQEMFRRLAAVVLDDAIAAESVREAVFRQIPRDELAGQFEESSEWLDGRQSHMFPGVIRRFEYVRRFFPPLLKHLCYEGQGPEGSEILRAVEVLRTMNRRLDPDLSQCERSEVFLVSLGFLSWGEFFFGE